MYQFAYIILEVCVHVLLIISKVRQVDLFHGVKCLLLIVK